MKQTLLAITLVGAALCSSQTASADPVAAAKVETLAPVKIRGRILAPDAAIDVSRAQPKLTLPALRQPFIGRIESTICRDPF